MKTAWTGFGWHENALSVAMGHYGFIQFFRRFSSKVSLYQSTEFDNLHGLCRGVLMDSQQSPHSSASVVGRCLSLACSIVLYDVLADAILIMACGRKVAASSRPGRVRVGFQLAKIDFGALLNIADAGIDGGVVVANELHRAAGGGNSNEPDHQASNDKGGFALGSSSRRDEGSVPSTFLEQP